MLSFDDGINNLLSCDNGPRSITPSKIVIRMSTPQRDRSNPRDNTRNSSNPRSTNRFDFPNSKDKTQLSRSTSKRKQRRWENSNMFGNELNELLTKKFKKFEDISDDEELAQYPLRIDWRSSFKDLLAKENVDALETFLLCQEKLLDSSKSKGKISHLSLPELAWRNIERKLRDILIKTLVRDFEIINVIFNLEQILLAFCHNEDLAVERFHPDNLHINISNPVILDNEGKLKIQFKNSTLNRLLLHTICQFYGLKSQSFQAKGSTNDKNDKFTTISKPKRATKVAQGKISFTEFLYSLFSVDLQRQNIESSLPLLMNNNDIHEMSSEFVMINLEESHE